MCLYICKYHTVQHQEIKSTPCNTQALYVLNIYVLEILVLENVLFLQVLKILSTSTVTLVRETTHHTGLCT